jgi:hypothetical protein
VTGAAYTWLRTNVACLVGQAKTEKRQIALSAAGGVVGAMLGFLEAWRGETKPRKDGTGRFDGLEGKGETARERMLFEAQDPGS